MLGLARPLTTALSLLLLAGASPHTPLGAQTAPAAAAEGVTGTWTVRLPDGGTLTLVLTQRARSITGTLAREGTSFRVQADAEASGEFIGSASNAQGALFIGGERSGAALRVILAEVNAAGVPLMNTAQEIVFTPAAATPTPPAAGTGVRALAESDADRRIAEVLLSSAWCYMRYSQQMGSTTTERVVFTPDGRVSQRDGRETAQNNQYGSYYGNSGSTQQAFWRIQNGQLMLSSDGREWQATPISIAPNSNGYPIVTSGGKEYSMCR